MKQLLSTLCDNGRELEAIGLTIVLDELERLIKDEPKAEGLLSDISGMIYNLFLVSQYFVPVLSHPLEYFDVTATQSKDYEYEKSFESVAMLDRFKEHVFDDQDKSEIAKLGAPANPWNELENASEKHRTGKAFEQRRFAEKCLDEFWSYMDMFMSSKWGVSPPKSLRRQLLLRKPPQQTELWVDRLPITSTQSVAEEEVLENQGTSFKIPAGESLAPHLMAIKLSRLRTVRTRPAEMTNTADMTRIASILRKANITKTPWTTRGTANMTSAASTMPSMKNMRAKNKTTRSARTTTTKTKRPTTETLTTTRKRSTFSITRLRRLKHAESRMHYPLVVLQLSMIILYLLLRRFLSITRRIKSSNCSSTRRV